MKRIVALLFAAMLLLTAVACGGTTTSSVPQAAVEAASEPETAGEAVQETETEAEPTVEPEPTLPPEPQPAFDASAKIMPWGDSAFMVLWYTEDAAKIAMETPAAGKYVLLHLAGTGIVDMQKVNDGAADYFTLRDANGNEHALSAVLTDPAYNPDMPRYCIDLVFDMPADMAAVGMTLLGHESSSSAVIIKLADVEAQ